MSSGFASRVADLERALEQVEDLLRGPDLERARALVAALLEVHRVALEDLSRALGAETLARAATAEPSIAWLLACHGLSAEALERAVADAQAKADARVARTMPQEPVLLPVERLVRREAAR